MKRKLLSVMVTFFVLVCVLEAFGQGHGNPFDVAIDTSGAGWAQIAYNPENNEYLAVWEDYRNGTSDVYGQFINGDNTLKGTNIPIAAGPGHQYWPHLDYDPYLHRFLVVFENWMEGGGSDIRGIFVNADGSFADAPTSGADHTFGICTNPANNYTCSVAFNTTNEVYLVVWGDFRNDPTGSSFTGEDVFGQLVDGSGTLLPPPSPADPATNFPVANNVDFDESVADVTYSPLINEFFVVYGTSTGYVLGQRIDAQGNRITQAGDIGNALPTTQSAIVISDYFQNGPDCLQAKVQANYENGSDFATDSWCECEVVWKGTHPPLTDNDVWGQRIAFFEEGQKWVAYYLALDGDTTRGTSNHQISIQTDWVGVPEIAFGGQDNEFLVGWGDPRKGGWSDNDLYCQRLWVDPVTKIMHFLADNRVDEVTQYENIPLLTTTNYEGSIMGIAHGVVRNEFVIAFTYEDYTMGRGNDIMGIPVFGSPAAAVDGGKASIPERFTVLSNYPNPFNPHTTITFGLPGPDRVSALVCDVKGRTIRTLFEGTMDAGMHSLAWDSRDNSGNGMPTGMYLLRIVWGNERVTQKMALVR